MKSLRKTKMKCQPTMMTTTDDLIARGYRRTSRKYGLVSRIDDPDWIKRLAKHSQRKLPEMEAMIRGAPGMWEDFFRRVLSKDTLELGQAKGLQVPCSSHDPVGYIEPALDGEEPLV